jgi:tight adherence protein B
VITFVITGALAAGVIAVAIACAPAARRSPVIGSVASRGGPPTDDLVNLLDHIAREVRSGLTIAAAAESALVARPAVLAPTAAALRRGSPLREALAASQHPNTDEALTLHAIELAHQSGGRAGDVITMAANVVRERHAWQHERYAQAAQARLSARVLTWLPLAFAVWGLVSSSRVRAAYGATPLVAWCTAAGVAINACGWWWMNRIIAGDTP